MQLLTSKQILADQDKIKKTLTGLDDQIHANAVQCLAHAEKHGDTSLMTRLLVNVIDAKTGYRRQGLINWMRKFSPMELVRDTINLSGLDAQGVKRPFKVSEADKTPFWLDSANAEQVAKPYFRDDLLSKINRAVKSVKDAIANTNPDGSAKDSTKPTYVDDGKAQVINFLETVETMSKALPVDTAKLKLEAIQAQAKLDAASKPKIDTNGEAVAA